MDQTTPFCLKVPMVLTIPLTLLITVGTGGTVTPGRIELLKGKDSGFANHCGLAPDNIGPSAYEVISAAQDIAFIRSILKVSTAELAKCVGVSRQSLYNWKSGSPLKNQNAERVHQLKMAATLLASEGLGATAHALRRTLSGGKTLLERIRADGDGHAAAQELVTMLRDERTVQKSLAERFAGRTSPLDPNDLG